jgi:hypothetical protein
MSLHANVRLFLLRAARFTMKPFQYFTRTPTSTSSAPGTQTTLTLLITLAGSFFIGSALARKHRTGSSIFGKLALSLST